ncbi:MAG: flagellar hook protein FlgE [Deltaproteobacteria bacterium]|nr:flagellar hook protein FlgE [Deltaproteobacteria bacterium]
MIYPVASQALAAMQQAQQMIADSAMRVARSAPSTNTIIDAAVSNSVATTSYSAAATVVRTADEMLGSLLDVIA